MEAAILAAEAARDSLRGRRPHDPAVATDAAALGERYRDARGRDGRRRPPLRALGGARRETRRPDAPALTPPPTRALRGLETRAGDAGVVEVA